MKATPRNHRTQILLITLVVGVAIAVSFAVWPTDAAHAGGDPRGRLLAELTPLVRVVPGYETGAIPWYSLGNEGISNSLRRYATEVEPYWDGCMLPGSGGWDPATIQVGFRWRGTPSALFALLSQRLRAIGWAVGVAPPWSQDQTSDPRMVYPTGRPPSEEFTWSRLAGSEWIGWFSAKPIGHLVDQNCP